MASVVSKNVTDEKVDAMKRYERRRSFSKYLPAIKALVAVLLLLSWLTPSFSAGEYLMWITRGGFTSGIFIFVVVNVLIGMILSLSNHEKLNEPDLYFEYVSTSTATPLGGFSSSSSSVAPVGSFSTSSRDKEEKTLEEKLGTDPFSITLEQADTTLTPIKARPMRREMVRAVSSVAETAHTVTRKREMTFLPSVTTENTTDHQVYRRSRSERLDVREDFQRSMRPLCYMDDLSSDEFRLTVETFIAGKKNMLSRNG